MAGVACNQRTMEDPARNSCDAQIHLREIARGGTGEAVNYFTSIDGLSRSIVKAVIVPAALFVAFGREIVALYCAGLCLLATRKEKT